MPPPSAVQAASLAPHIFLPKNLSHKSLQPSIVCRCPPLFLSQSRRIRTSSVFAYPSLSNSSNALRIRTPAAAASATAASVPYNIYANTEGAKIAQGPDDDVPEPGMQFAEFAAGHFWGVELAFQRVPGVTKTEVGFSQGFRHNPTWGDVNCGNTMHAEVVRVQYDPNECSYETLLDTFWSIHDPTTLNRQGYDLGTQYRSGIYFYSAEQERAARESLERQQQKLNKKVVTEIMPAKKFYRAGDIHQQRLSKFGHLAEKGCKEPIRRYGRHYKV
uniref:peptide-methionine (S)-S-oxide reductase n=1 Tax=Araucaria cunninghamii TaxID=56994 RepID=A0A0D6R7A4_ARACU